MNTFIIIVGILLAVIIIALTLALSEVKRANKSHLKSIQIWKDEYQRLSEMYQMLSKDLSKVSEKYIALEKQLADKENLKAGNDPDSLQMAVQAENVTNNTKPDPATPGKPAKRAYKKRKKE